MNQEDPRENHEKKRKVSNITKENNKEFVKDGMTTTEIRTTVRYIREYIEKNDTTSLEDKQKHLEMMHKLFHERYPILFDMCTRPEFNFQHLDYFLNKREDIINDKISSEDASKEIGEVWFNKFVDTSKLDKK